MSALSMRLRTLFAALVLLSPAPLAAQEGITVTDFVGAASFPLSATPDIRRGTTTRIRIVRDYIDLSGDPTVGGSGVSLSSITRGRTSAGKGFIQMNVNVSETHNTGSNIRINVPAPDPNLPTVQSIFFLNLNVVHKGQINTVNFVPNPSTIPSGQAFEVTVNGSDLGEAPNIANLPCHSVAVLTRVNSSFRVRLNANCGNPGPFNFNVLSSNPRDPNQYATSQGTMDFQFGPYGGCVAEPNLGAPVVIAPQHNQVFQFLPTAPRIISMQFRWHRATSNNINAPLNEWLVEFPQRDLTDGGPTVILPPQVKTVTDTTITEPFRRPGTYNVAIRGRNCGSGSLGTTVRFELR